MTASQDHPRVCIRLPQSWCIASVDAIVKVAELADSLGFWGVSVQDHLLADSAVSPCGLDHAEDRKVFESIQTLSYVAARTESLRLVTAVVVLAFRNPIWLAKQLATLDVLSGGRAVIGVGIGASRTRAADQEQSLVAHRDIAVREFDLLGVAGHRGRLTDEYIDALKMLWTQDAPTYHGRHVQFDHVDLYPKPVQASGPPIWVGGRSTAAHVRAAMHADGWFPSQETVEGYADGKRAVLRLAADAGRPAPTGWGVNLFTSIAASSEGARAVMRSGLGHRFQGDDALFASTIAGNPEEVLDRMRRYVAAGVRTFDLKILPLTLDETLHQMHVLAEEVLPAL